MKAEGKNMCVKQTIAKHRLLVLRFSGVAEIALILVHRENYSLSNGFSKKKRQVKK